IGHGGILPRLGLDRGCLDALLLRIVRGPGTARRLGTAHLQMPRRSITRFPSRSRRSTALKGVWSTSSTTTSDCSIASGYASRGSSAASPESESKLGSDTTTRPGYDLA